MSGFVKDREIIADNLSKAGWRAGSQQWIPRANQSGLLTRTATTEGALSCMLTKSSARLWSLSRPFALERPLGTWRLTTGSESKDLGVRNASRLAACQATPSIKTRRRLTRQICRDDGKSLLDYVIRRFNLSSARLNKPQGWIFAETPFSAISRSNWSPESAEGRPLFKAPREDGSWFCAELDCSSCSSTIQPQ